MGVFFACMGASVCMLAATAPPPSERHDSAISNVINFASLSLTTQHIGPYLVAI